MPWIYTGHHKWLVGEALNRSFKYYLAPEASTTGTSDSTANQRNKLASTAIKETDATHLVFVDWDVVPPPDAIKKLIIQDKDAISGLYYAKDDMQRMICIKDASGKTPGILQDGLNEVDIFCMGMSVIKREVFEKLEYPYFRPQNGEQDGDWQFCEAIRKAGFRVYVDSDIVGDHYGVFSNLK